jgi:hypothetical protein
MVRPFSDCARVHALFHHTDHTHTTVASYYDDDTYVYSLSQINFLIFCSVWTAFIVVPYLTLAPRFYPAASHKFAVLAAEAVTMIFWFAGFIAGAVFVTGLAFCDASPCSSARAGVVFAAFEW